jgi:hypothetical protein
MLDFGLRKGGIAKKEDLRHAQESSPDRKR